MKFIKRTDEVNRAFRVIQFAGAYQKISAHQANLVKLAFLRGIL